jgi:hypothetical protein
MGARNGTIRHSEGTRLKSGSIETTLYALIGAIQEVLPREEEKMVTLVVCHLLNRTTARFQSVSRGHGRKWSSPAVAEVLVRPVSSKRRVEINPAGKHASF